MMISGPGTAQRTSPLSTYSIRGYPVLCSVVLLPSSAAEGNGGSSGGGGGSSPLFDSPAPMLFLQYGTHRRLLRCAATGAFPSSTLPSNSLGAGKAMEVTVWRACESEPRVAAAPSPSSSMSGAGPGYQQQHPQHMLLYHPPAAAGWWSRSEMDEAGEAMDLSRRRKNSVREDVGLREAIAFFGRRWQQLMVTSPLFMCLSPAILDAFRYHQTSASTAPSRPPSALPLSVTPSEESGDHSILDLASGTPAAAAAAQEVVVEQQSLQRATPIRSQSPSSASKLLHLSSSHTAASGSRLARHSLAETHLEAQLRSLTKGDHPLALLLSLDPTATISSCSSGHHITTTNNSGISSRRPSTTSSCRSAAPSPAPPPEWLLARIKREPVPMAAPLAVLRRAVLRDTGHSNHNTSGGGTVPGVLRPALWRLLCGMTPSSVHTSRQLFKELCQQYTERDIHTIFYGKIGTAGEEATERAEDEGGATASPARRQRHHPLSMRPREALGESDWKALFSSMSPSSQRLLNQLVRLDLHRHSSSLCHFIPTALAITQGLFLWCQRHPAVGYMQGFDDIYMVVFLVFFTDAVREVYGDRGSLLLKRAQQSGTTGVRGRLPAALSSLTAAIGSNSCFLRSFLFAESLTEDLVASLSEEELYDEADVAAQESQRTKCTDGMTDGLPSAAAADQSSSSSSSYLSSEVLMAVSADTYFCFSHFMDELYGTYSREQEVGIGSSLINQLLKQLHPPLAAVLLDSEDMPPLHILCFSWVHSLLNRELPLPLLLPLWDAYFAIGPSHISHLHVYVCVVMICSLGPLLLQQADVERRVEVLRRPYQSLFSSGSNSRHLWESEAAEASSSGRPHPLCRELFARLARGTGSGQGRVLPNEWLQAVLHTARLHYDNSRKKERKESIR